MSGEAGLEAVAKRCRETGLRRDGLSSYPGENSRKEAVRWSVTCSWNWLISISLALYYNIKSVHYRYVIDSLCLRWMWLWQPSEWVRFWLQWSSPEAPLRPELLVSKEGYQFCDSKVPWPNGQGSRFFQALELYLSTIVIFMLKVSKKVSCVIAVRWLCLITHLHFLHLKFPWKHLCVSHVYIHTRTHTYIYTILYRNYIILYCIKLYSIILYSIISYYIKF
jgi:hypothetical protein